MVTLDIVIRLAASSASAAAWLALVLDGNKWRHYGAKSFAFYSSAGTLISLVPAWWDFEAAATIEVAMAACALVAALEATREAFREQPGADDIWAWARVLGMALLGASVFALVGVVGAYAVPLGDYSAYRGLAAAEGLVMAFVLGVRTGIHYHGRRVGRVHQVLLAWLPWYLGLQGIHLAAWELSPRLAIWLGVPVATVGVGTMLSLAQAGFRDREERPAVERF